MYATIMLVIIILVTSPYVMFGRRRITSGSDASDCHYEKCGGVTNLFNCRCESSGWKEAEPECIPTTWLCDGEQDCSNSADERECRCPPGSFQCGGDRGGEVEDWRDQYNCIPIALVGDDNRYRKLFLHDCFNLKDRLGRSSCWQWFDPSRDRCDSYIDCLDASDEKGCDGCPSDRPNRCACNQPGDEFSCGGLRRRTCYPDAWRCDGYPHCADGSDEGDCPCKNDEFTCQCYLNQERSCSFHEACISMEKYRDEEEDCENGSDERKYLRKTKCNSCDVTIRRLDSVEQCENYSDCDNKTCIVVPALNCTDNTKCNATEVICESFCNMSNASQSCNTIFQCEHGYLEFAHNFCDGKVDCPDRSDEIIDQHGFKCSSSFGRCVLPQRNLHDDIPQCEDASDLCSNQSCFECVDGKLKVSQTQWCDGKVDCLDGSDEIIDQHGFKCSSSFGRCVLPQRNLHDDVPQCEDASDLCLNRSCFECVDGKLNISLTQLCDGVIDCFDLSDECLCQAHFHKPVCEKMFVLNDPFNLKCGQLNSQCHEITATSIETAQCSNQYTFNQSTSVNETSFPPSLINCQNKFRVITATACDGHPECRNLEDECSCDNPPSFCNSSCHNHHAIGDRYCDGVIDEAWKFINDSSCPKGFDEKSCSQRFECKAGILVSIDRVLVCDGFENCDDGSDENSCETRSHSFASDYQAIASKLVLGVFWAMGLLVIIGNCSVMLSTIRLLCKHKMSESQNCNHILILNLSFSDLLMGFYLLSVAIKSVQYSGYYAEVDSQWRSSLECSIVGSLAVISSETSCFIMTIITAFRLYNVFKPFTARTASTLPWKVAIALAWVASLALGLLPILKGVSDYFVHGIWLSKQFTSGKDWNKTDVMTLACRLASLSNQSIEDSGDSWESTRKFLNHKFPSFSLMGEFGYYSDTSICMPRIYVVYGGYTWLYSLTFITFNFISFIFFAISYVLICFKTSHRPTQTSKSEKEAARMQLRIARLIVTDFACWVPICIFVYLKMGGVDLPDVVYVITPDVLLPINSALNPLLYSPIVEKYFKRIFCKKKRPDPQT